MDCRHDGHDDARPCPLAGDVRAHRRDAGGSAREGVMTSTLLLTLCLATLHAQAPRYTLGDLEQRALAAHPALAVAQAESQAIKQAAEQAGALPNPVVGYL